VIYQLKGHDQGHHIMHVETDECVGWLEPLNQEPPTSPPTAKRATLGIERRAGVAISGLFRTDGYDHTVDLDQECHCRLVGCRSLFNCMPERRDLLSCRYTGDQS